MPWTEAQVKTLRAIEHGWRPSNKAFEGVSRKKAGKMADEGVKHEVVSRSVKRMKHG